MENSDVHIIKNKDKLLEAIKYTHLTCFELCKKNFGKYLPVAGNIGIFCHQDDEYEFLTKLRKELTEESNNWNKKYYRLLEPIIIPPQGEIPGATYTYLYVRKPDQHKEVGDVDFVLDKEEYLKLKNSLLSGTKIKGVEIFNRPGLDLIKLFDKNIDVVSLIGTKYMVENLKIKE
ncbi:MAG: hypothetical protein NTZ87_00760 [Candidatus Nomurabacteria bacterium]|nr:hypothetical protein [Candidatus Nomurabacteria bacterium]